MAATILVPKSLFDKVDNFVSSNGIAIEIVQDGVADIRIVAAGAGVESDDVTLQSGGWIKCGTAHILAYKLGVSLKQAGELLNLLNIKIRNCELGCF